MAEHSTRGRLARKHPGGFGVVPTELMRDPDHTATHLAVYAALGSLVDFASGRGPARIAAIAERAGASVRATGSALRWLEGRGYLRSGVDAAHRRGAKITWELLSSDPSSLAEAREHHQTSALIADVDRKGRQRRTKGRQPLPTDIGNSCRGLNVAQNLSSEEEPGSGATPPHQPLIDYNRRPLLSEEAANA